MQPVSFKGLFIPAILYAIFCVRNQTLKAFVINTLSEGKIVLYRNCTKNCKCKMLGLNQDITSMKY